MLGYNCDIFMPEGQPCEFPFRPGSYFKGTYDFTVPELPDIWNPDIFKGNFFWKFFGLKPDGTKFFCVSLTYELN